MKKTIKHLASIAVVAVFLFIAFGSDDSESSSSSSSYSSTYSCGYCGDSFTGRGYTTAMRVVNRVDDEFSPLNSYCSSSCARDCISVECFTW